MTLRHVHGLSLIELMIAIALGLFVLLVATSLLVSTKTGYTTQDEMSRLQDNGRYALDVIRRAVRQAGQADWSGAGGPLTDLTDLQPPVEGMDAARLKARTPGIESPLPGSVHDSDVLALRFFGSGSGEHGDGTLFNCAGFGVPAPRNRLSIEAERGWSVFYVGEDTEGEPELYCKFRSGGTWSAQAIARGVESFQVLYGLDMDGDAVPDRIENARGVERLDGDLVLSGPNATARLQDWRRQTHWRRVVTVEVALLIRGAQQARTDGAGEQHLFGEAYSIAHGAEDSGTHLHEADLKVDERRRLRKVFSTTIQLRNPLLLTSED